MIATVLFAGCGGSSVGLENAGYRTTGYEYWGPAAETHRANGMECLLHDLSDAAADERLASCDLLWASPPCQPFSAAGSGDGEFDDRDGFPWTLRIIGRLRPPLVIVENVKGLTFDKHAVYFGSILHALADLGYEWEWKVLNSADYGVPQTRERCFIVARNDDRPIRWPMPTHTAGDSLFLEPWVTMAKALGWGMTDRPFSTIATSSPTGGPRMDGCGDSGARAALVAERDSGRWILNVGQSERSGRVNPPITQPAPTVTTTAGMQWTLDYRQTNRDGDPITCDVTDRPAPTVGTQSQGQWIVNETIRLTIGELARLQGFPDDYVWTSTKTNQARMIGNAVPPVMAQRLAEANS